MSEIHYKEVKPYLKQITKEQFAPVYLIFGDEFLYKTALEDLLSVILPGNQRAFNYEQMDDNEGNLYEGLERLNTFNFMSDKKVIAFCDSRMFDSKNDEKSLFEKAKESFGQNEYRKSSQYFVSLLSILNLSFDDIRKENRNKSLYSLSETPADEDWIERIGGYCTENNIVIPALQDSASVLQKAIQKGFPTGNYLVITTDHVNKKSGLYKTIKECGVVFDCSVPTSDRRADREVQETVLKEQMRLILNKYGKKTDNVAYNKLIEITGFNIRTFCSSLEKLVDYTGDRDTITADDVVSVTKRTRQDPIYELTNAVSDRKADRALFFVDSLLFNNIHPLQILAAIVNHVRKILIIKGFTGRRNGSSWHGGMNYNQFKDRVMPEVMAHDDEFTNQFQASGETSEEITAGSASKNRKNVNTDLLIAGKTKNPYPIYQSFLKAERFSQEELIKAFGILGEADFQIKSSSIEPKYILGNAIMRICHKKP